jgi:4-diphosphocytidyl-2-C-methyl-D-erythritol kinase
LQTFAPAKVNLTLRVIGRRPDGYHLIESLVAFASVGDSLSLRPGEPLSLQVSGPTGSGAGSKEENLVLKAARALATRVPGLKTGAFHLTKRLPVGAGVGGGSADAAAALRLLATVNGLAADHPAVIASACATGADVSVCLASRSCVMSGIGEQLSEPLELPPLATVLVNPRVPLPTKDVFAAARDVDWRGPSGAMPPSRSDALMPFLHDHRNDLEPAAIRLQPIIADVLASIRGTAQCELARMSGSGATCFGLFPTGSAARSAAAVLRQRFPGYWVRPTMLGKAAVEVAPTSDG